MEQKLVCQYNKCTACGACLNICPNSCISFEVDEYEVKRASINEEGCSQCNLCRKVCPSNNEIPGSVPMVCYAAWSLDETIRRMSASGGMAAELYRYAVDNGYWIAGVRLTENFEAIYELTDRDYSEFQNSKYTFSSMGKIYLEISDKLRTNRKILFVGLPCQAAGLRAYLKLKNIEDTNLFIVDLVCHGSPPEAYLKQHIIQIQRGKKEKADRVNFRDPKYETDRFYLTLANHGKVFYKKQVTQDDEYQIAYHRGLAYRENCYFCNWASAKRIGDITLSDFWGLGTKADCNYSHKNVSCVMINTLKGESLYRELKQGEKIFSEQRPLEENLNTQPTLNHPTPRPPERERFLSCYLETKDFDRSVQVAASKIICLNRLNSVTKYREIKLFLLKLIPRDMKDQVKRIFRR